MSSVAKAQEPPVLINYGMTGTWYEPATSGQGFLFDLIPSRNFVSASWFTYPIEGGAREWYLATGDVSGDSASLTVYQTENGFFDQASMVETNVVGSATLEFSSCTQAIWTYQLDTQNLSGEIPLQRISSDFLCKQLLATTNTTIVSHTNAWVNIQGAWLFVGCVNLENSDSHGDELFEFTDETATLKIDRYSEPDCQGTKSQQVLTLDLQRVDKTLAFLDGEEVIANRFIMTDAQSGQTIKQLFYVDDRSGKPLLTHGLLDSQLDSQGFPTELPLLFFEQLEDGQ